MLGSWLQHLIEWRKVSDIQFKFLLVHAFQCGPSFRYCVISVKLKVFQLTFCFETPFLVISQALPGPVDLFSFQHVIETFSPQWFSLKPNGHC